MDTKELNRFKLADDMVRRGVHYCVSSLLHTLTQTLSPGRDATADLCSLCEQAMELAAPIPDYEEVAIQEGWTLAKDTGRWCLESESRDAVEDREEYLSAEDACREHNIDPYDREVYEHWIVSDWLVRRLAEKGEKVDTDFAGLTVWARTCTGQSIALDSVIKAIAVEANSAS